MVERPAAGCFYIHPLAALMVLSSVSTSHASNSQTDDLMTITGHIRLLDCKRNPCGYVWLVEARPVSGQRRTAIVKIGNNLTFFIHTSSVALPPGRYEVETGLDAKDLSWTGEIVDIPQYDKDFGLICFEDSCMDL
jgi:hypothetical protein